MKFAIGTQVFVAAFRGENGDKTHCTTGIIEAGEKGEAVLATAAKYACDGYHMQAGNGGMFRGTGQIICQQGAEGEAAALDAAITCEACRANMGMGPVEKSPLALAAVEARKAAAKVAATAKKNADKAEALKADIARTQQSIEAARQYIATPDAELIAAYIAEITKGCNYSEAIMAKIHADPKFAEDIAERKASKARYIKRDEADLKKKVAKLATL